MFQLMAFCKASDTHSIDLNKGKNVFHPYTEMSKVLTYKHVITLNSCV